MAFLTERSQGSASSLGVAPLPHSYSVAYISGRLHQDADWLSRYPVDHTGASDIDPGPCVLSMSQYLQIGDSNAGMLLYDRRSTTLKLRRTTRHYACSSSWIAHYTAVMSSPTALICFSPNLNICARLLCISFMMNQLLGTSGYLARTTVFAPLLLARSRPFNSTSRRRFREMPTPETTDRAPC